MSTNRGDDRFAVGRVGEQFAAEYLERSLGWQIRRRNWRCRMGEIDLVAEYGDCLIAVEVRTRRSNICGTPTESVAGQKIRRLVRLFPMLIEDLGWSLSSGGFRLDVLGLTMQSGTIRSLVHLKNVTVD